MGAGGAGGSEPLIPVCGGPEINAEPQLLLRWQIGEEKEK